MPLGHGRAKPLTIEDKAVMRAWVHLLRRGGDDIFTPPVFTPSFEILLASKNKETRRNILRRSYNTIRNMKADTLDIPHRLNVPKNRFAFRAATHLDIFDAVQFLSLAIYLAPTIEANRIPEADETVHSYRFMACGSLFNRRYNYATFKRRSDSISESGSFKVKVTTDIANFYDRLNIHRLESSLIDIGIHGRLVQAVIEVLMHWSGRNSYGIPVGCDASRILAEAALIPVDNTLRRANVPFIRFVDDFRLFARNYTEANSHISVLTEALDREGLFINTSKTSFIDLAISASEDDSDTDIERFTAIDDKTEIEQKIVVWVNYTRRIVKKYIRPGEQQIQRYRQIDYSQLCANLVIGNIEEPKIEPSVRDIVKSFIYQEDLDPDSLINVLERYFHLLPYFCDAVQQERHRLTDRQKDKLGDYFFGRLVNGFSRNGERLPEYYLVVTLKLAVILLQPSGSLRHRIMDVIPSDFNPLALREFILILGRDAPRDFLLRLRGMFGNSSKCVRRAIFLVWIQSEKLLPSEKRAWTRQLSKLPDDPVIRNHAMRITFQDSRANERAASVVEEPISASH